VSGDMSGIQDFIFNIATDEKVARSLKGRSFFVQLLSEVCAQLILDELSLDESCVILNSGGNFLLLVPAEKEDQLKTCKKKIDTALKEESLYLALGWEKCNRDALEKNFSEVLDKAKAKSAAAKKKKFESLKVEGVFSPFPQQNQDNRKYDELTDKLISAKGYIITKFQTPNYTNWQKPLCALGYEIKFVEQPSKNAVEFNPKTPNNNWKSYRFAVKDLPTIDFDGLAQKAKERTGTEKLAVLKMDVDNLGKLFKESLPNHQRSATEIAKISRALALFFEGEISVFLKAEKYRNDIYPIFSGGDDFFIVGAWDRVFEFAEFIQEKFREFVTNHPVLTLSAALLVVDAKFPVARFAPLADERLDDAKIYGGKNCINVFDVNLSWSDFKAAKELKMKLVRLVELEKSRAIVEKVQKSSIGLGKILNQAKEKRKIDMVRVWRLAYYLRVTKREESQKIVEEVIKQYEQLIFGAMKGQAVNPELVSVAARWAEFETRKKHETEQES
ncbi:MAG: hypothetical protein SNJ66_14775, partial [Chloroherpetonaceae bacterium]